jgi:hypothetical protein
MEGVPIFVSAASHSLHPDNSRPAGAHHAGQSIDSRYDFTSKRNLAGEALGDEMVLHVDHD